MLCHPQVRPVPLEIRILGYDVQHMGARLLAMARPAYGALVNNCSPGKPAIVFVPTRKQAQLSAIDFVTFAAADGRGDAFLLAGAESSKVRCGTCGLLYRCRSRSGCSSHVLLSLARLKRTVLFCRQSAHCMFIMLHLTSPVLFSMFR